MPEQTTDHYREHLEREVEFALKRVAEQGRTVEQIAGSTARRAESAERPVISELGELQGAAGLFDTACARYMVLRRALDDYDKIRGRDV